MIQSFMKRCMSLASAALFAAAALFVTDAQAQTDPLVIGWNTTSCSSSGGVGTFMCNNFAAEFLAAQNDDAAIHPPEQQRLGRRQRHGDRSDRRVRRNKHDLSAHVAVSGNPRRIAVVLPGLAIGAVYARTGRVRDCVALHAAMNAAWLGAHAVL